MIMSKRLPKERSVKKKKKKDASYVAQHDKSPLMEFVIVRSLSKFCTSISIIIVWKDGKGLCVN